MPDLDELRALARAEAAVAGEPTVTLSASEGQGAVVALLRYFGEDNGRGGVTLVIEGEQVGHLHRADALSLVADATRGGASPGYGSSAGMNLPGHEPYRLLRLRCPIPGCPTEDQLRMTYDEDDPPRCSIHHEAVLELV
jgi:hypothetical protein